MDDFFLEHIDIIAGIMVTLGVIVLIMQIASALHRTPAQAQVKTTSTPKIDDFTNVDRRFYF